MLRLEHLTKLFKSAQAKTGAFLHSQGWKEALVFFCFVLLSFGFWLLQSLQQEYEIQISIPVRYKNIPPDISFSGALPEDVKATVKDKGSVLLNYSFGRIFAPLEVNLKELSVKKGALDVGRRVVESNILKQLLATTTLVGFEPQQINTPFSQRMSKDVPVVFQGDIQTEPGFQQSESIVIKPLQVKVFASSEVLDSIYEVKTLYTSIEKGNKTITRIVQLQPIEGTAFAPAEVTVTIPIEEYTEKTLEIPVVCLDIPSDYTVRTFPSFVKVVCNIPLSRFKSLSEEEFNIHIPFDYLEQNMSGVCPIQLSRKPDWVRTATLVPDRIEFILEQNMLK